MEAKEVCVSMMSPRCRVFSILIVAITASSSAASQGTKDAEKAPRIQEALRGNPMKMYEGVEAKNRQFCTSLYKGLAWASAEVLYQEPVVKTNDTNHPTLRKYEECRQQRGPTSPSTFYGLAAIGTHDFRLYVARVQTASEKAAQEYLYGEDPADSKLPRAMYAGINLATCEFEDLTPVAAENSLEQVPELRGINALVRFRNRYVIYSYRPGQLVVWGADPIHQDMRRGQICAWNPKPQPKTEPIELK
jgi:hypothetical protein